MSSSASVAARVTGVIGALGYLTGLVDGPVLGILGGLALLSFGRALASERGAELIAPASFGVLAGAAGVVALRWGTLDLNGIGGIQAVLGPIVTVSPAPVAAMAGAALAAAAGAAGVGLTEPAPGIGAPRWWWWVEAGTVSGVLALMFGGSPFAGLAGAALWVGATALLGAVVVATSKVLGPRAVPVRLVAIGICAAVVVVAAIVIGAFS